LKGGATGLVASFSFKQSDYCRLEWGKIAFGSVPDAAEIDTEVVMNQFVSHPCNVLPRRLRAAISNVWWDPLCGLADDL